MISFQQLKIHCNQCKRTYKDEVLYGKRCLQTVEVFYDTKDKIFHRKQKEGRVKTWFIQNTKKGFYVKDIGVISEYFYDSYEGWYIRSYYNGFKYNYGCEASAKYRQCYWALEIQYKQFCFGNTEDKIMIASISILIYRTQFRKELKQMNYFVTFCLLFCLVTAQTRTIEQQSRSQNSSSDSSDHLPPSVRKCLNVSCDAGTFCFHGRCKKIDYLCIGKKCSEGERCNKGVCLKQLHNPKKQICVPLGFQQTKLRCSDELRAQCLYTKSSIKVCGFFPNRTRQDFDNQCSACTLGTQVRFYYQTTCQWAPHVCNEEQECMNGVCITIFNEEVFKNNRACNENKDCKAHERCGGHKCIDRRDLFNYLQSKDQEKKIGLKI